MRSLRLAPLALAAVLACVSHPQPTAADLDTAITRADFNDWLSAYALETKRERFGKAEKKGVVILEYDWLGDDGELAIEIKSRAYWTHTPAESEAAYRLMLKGARKNRDGIAWVPVHTGGSWAEEKKCYRLVRADRQTVGHALFARRDNVAVMVLLAGLHTENPKQFERKLEPELEKLSRHTP